MYAENGFDAVAHHGRNENAVEPRIGVLLFDAVHQLAEGFARAVDGADVQPDTIDLGLVSDIRRGDLEHHRKAEFPRRVRRLIGGCCQAIGNDRQSGAGEQALGFLFADGTAGKRARGTAWRRHGWRRRRLESLVNSMQGGHRAHRAGGILEYQAAGIFIAADDFLRRDDAIVAFLTFVAAAESMVAPVRRAIENAHAKYPDRLIVQVIVAPEEIVRRYEDAGCLVFEDPTRAVRAVAALHQIHQAFEAPSSPTVPADGGAARPIPDHPLGEQESRRLLAGAGLTVIADRLTTTADEAADAARELGFPVVLKIASAEIAHKTEVDGVRLDIGSTEDAREAFSELMDGVKRRRPDARLDGVLVSPMMRGGIETILGIHRDPVFGPMVMFGLGGVFVEVLDDVSFRVAPFDEDQARRMVFELKGRAILEGTRGRGPYDLPALFTALARLSQFAAVHADTIESVDVNPFLVLPEGRGAIALDALVVPKQGSPG